MRLFVSIIFICIIISSELFAQKSSDLVYVSALGSSKFVPGSIYKFALKYKISPDWHIYWRNPGDTGIQTSINLNIPDGIAIIDTIWQNPIRYASEELTDFIYSDSAYIFFSLSIPKQFRDSIVISGISNFLVCKEKCIPGSSNFSFTIFAASHDLDYFNREFKEALNNCASTSHMWTASSYIEGEYLFLELYNQYMTIKHPEDLVFFPIEGGFFSSSFVPLVDKEDNIIRVKFKLDQYRSEDPKKFSFVMISKNEQLNMTKQKSILLTTSIE